MTAATALPVHPEQMGGDAALLRWRVPADAVPFLGDVTAAPGALGRLLADGTLAAVTLEPGAVLIRAGDRTTWRHLGGPVRTALLEALATPDGWRGRPETGDDVLARAAAAVLDGLVGDTIRSHGGRVRITGVRDGVVWLHLSGACAGCPASGVTLTDGFEREVRARYPGLVGVRATEEKPRGPRGRVFLPLRRRG